MPTLHLIPNHYKLTTIELRINNIPHYFIVDTGASKTHVAPNVLSKIEQTSVKQVPTMGIDGIISMFKVKQVFNFCGVRIEELTIDQNIQRLTSQTGGLVLSGLIGQDILRQFKRVIIDNVQETITFEL